jgi:hypothetical protein
MKALRFIWLVALVATAALIPSVAGAATHPTYALGHATKCRADYHKSTLTHVVRGKRVRYVACVYKAPVIVTPVTTTTTPVTTTAPPTTTTTTPPVTTTAPTVSLGVTLDPTYTQDPTNALIVTFTYSASATTTTDNVTLADSSLPSGVLNFYNDGLLACTTNVGASTSSGQCTVTYPSTGTNSVVTEYLSGTNSVSQSENVDIQPFTTTTQASFTVVSSSTGGYIGGKDNTKTVVDLSAATTDQNGATVSPAAGALSFNISGFGTFTTTTAGQTECTLTIFGSAVGAFESSNCTEPAGVTCSFEYACNNPNNDSLPPVVEGTADFAGSSIDASSEGGAIVTLSNS